MEFSKNCFLVAFYRTISILLGKMALHRFRILRVVSVRKKNKKSYKMILSDKYDQCSFFVLFSGFKPFQVIIEMRTRNCLWKLSLDRKITKWYKCNTFPATRNFRQKFAFRFLFENIDSTLLHPYKSGQLYKRYLSIWYMCFSTFHVYSIVPNHLKYLW